MVLNQHHLARLQLSEYLNVWRVAFLYMLNLIFHKNLALASQVLYTQVQSKSYLLGTLELISVFVKHSSRCEFLALYDLIHPLASYVQLDPALESPEAFDIDSAEHDRFLVIIIDLPQKQLYLSINHLLNIDLMGQKLSHQYFLVPLRLKKYFRTNYKPNNIKVQTKIKRGT